MDDQTLHHIIYRIANAPIQSYPYPHFYVEKIFPDRFYQDLLTSFPTLPHFVNLSQTGSVTPGSYQERFVLTLEKSNLNKLNFIQNVFWQRFYLAIQNNSWISMLLKKFQPYIKKRFGKNYPNITFSPVAELICDQTHYAIGPHTDLPGRALTLLFYFPQTSTLSHLGTSLYRPIDPTFKCKGLTHHSFDDFIKVQTVPFLPNSVFGFCKSDHSFHGVEPIEEKKVQRNLMNYYLRWAQK